MFAKWTIDGVQHQFNKNWLDRQKNGVSQKHIEPLILTKIQINILTRAELLYTLCYEVPCTLYLDLDIMSFSLKLQHY